ncbi:MULTISPECIES: hypothetical protein [Streptomyces]|uniref:ATP-grasp domain-containing protein n=1 Tax=Streptomyces noboritoensis TaxID=67337 RepID=A0ABV6TCG8_9ACTN|nr:hypothetical protein [Streptomyces melanogenes]GGP78655.1 hypothetical protein GCM10010278_66410 [Streptomyces melanogenes]
MDTDSLLAPRPYGADKEAPARRSVVVLHGGQYADSAAHSLMCARTVADAVTNLGGEAHLVESDGCAIPSLVDKLDSELEAILTIADVPRDAGTLQGLLNYLDIPYAGSGVAGCSTAALPVTVRRLLQAADVPVPPYGLVRPHASPHREAHRIMQEASSWSVCIQSLAPARRPAGPGDTAWTGPAFAAEPDALTDLLTLAAPHGPLMYESDIGGQTLWVAVIDDLEGQPHTLPVQEATPSLAPASKEILARARQLALRAQAALHLRGYSLHRFTRYQDTLLIWRGVQIHPDLSPTGRLFQIAEAHHGWTHPDFVNALLNTCVTDQSYEGL